MRIVIRETNSSEELVLLDPKTGANMAVDIIGNLGALDDGQFELDDDTGLHHCNQETFNFWTEYLV